MNLQQELEAAVSKTTAAAAKLHAIVNGDAGTVEITKAAARE